jgi:hypothetical protein
MAYLRTGWQTLVQGLTLVGASQLGESFDESCNDTVNDSNQTR